MAVTINIWNREEFLRNARFTKYGILGYFKEFGRRIKWSYQRIVRGYADCDRWSICDYLQTLIPAMLQDLRDNAFGAPAYLCENDPLAGHEEWNRILDKMIFLWHEADSETCSMKNPYEEEHTKSFEEFERKYGILGEKLQTEEELERGRKTGCSTAHLMGELPEYREIDEKYDAESRKIDEYRMKCQAEALDMLKQYFNDLWD